jgi:SagB-type dehydrogenase family enzyme
MPKLSKFRRLWSEVKTQQLAPTSKQIGQPWADEYRQKEFSTGNLLEVFHENTKLNVQPDIKDNRSFARYNAPRYQYLQSNVPEHPDRERIDLPKPRSLDVPLSDVLANRRTTREMTGDPLTLREISTVLQHTCGVTEKQEYKIEGMHELDDETTDRYLRAYPSGGGLYPVRPYFLVPNAPEGLDRGVCYYVPEKHCLRVIKRDPELPERIEADGLFAVSEKGADPADSGITLLLTARFWRSMAKYGPRAYRLILQESGHIVQNASLAAEALGFVSTPLGTYNDGPLNEYLDVNGVDEAVIYAVTVGRKPAEQNDAATSK